MMRVLERNEAFVTILEAEILYLCADLGGEVLARAIDVIHTLHADRAQANVSAHPATNAVVLPFPRQSIALDAIG